VGNRLSETTAFTNTIYAYDAANRMTSVNGAPFSWDANGNLLSDGVNTYAYDHANRLIGLTQGGSTYAFAYNGLGNRLQQTVDAVTTNYTVDLNAGLTQVLTDGTNAYLYGVSRIGQQGADWAYHLPDALGSVRQLADAGGAVSYAAAYEPYGETLAAFGSQRTTYGFAGEWTDRTGLQYLRARYYAPEVGRFISRDSWMGQMTNPMTMNKWAYANANPGRFVDPTGNCPKPESGSFICVDLFIQTETILGFGRGDGRSFSSDSDPRKSRAFLYIKLNAEGKIETRMAQINKSCLTIGLCFGPSHGLNHFDAIQLTNGDIRVDWKLYNGVSGSIADLKSFLLNNNLIIPFLALSCGYSPFDLDPIDGTLTLSRGSNGVWRLKQLNRDPYPSLGVYQYQNGNLVKIIIERNEWPSGQPDVGLRPEAPNDVYP